MERLYFLAAELDHAQALVKDLLANGVPEEQLYAIAAAGQDAAGLPNAGETADDLLPSYQRGITLGGGTGLAAGLVARLLAPFGVGVGGILLAGLLGAGLGGLLTGPVGSAFSRVDFKHLRHELDRGRILILAEVEPQQQQHLETLVQDFHPDIGRMGPEPRAHLLP